MLEALVRSLGWEDPLEKGTVTHSSILAQRIMDCIVHGVAKSRTRLSDFHFQRLDALRFSVSTLEEGRLLSLLAIWCTSHLCHSLHHGTLGNCKLPYTGKYIRKQGLTISLTTITTTVLSQYLLIFFSIYFYQLEANYFTILQWFLPYIDMNQPWLYMCSPPRSPLPPPSPSHPWEDPIFIDFNVW